MTGNLVGVGIAITAIVVNSISTANMGGEFAWTCRYYSDYRTPSPIEDIMRKNCEEATALALVSVWQSI